VTQTGDYVTALAAHFNTTPEEILAANPGLPLTTTLPVGMRLDIPSYYFPLGGPVNAILPDSEFVYGPAQSGFDLAAYIEAQPGFLKSLSAFVNKKQRSAAGTVAYVAAQYSLNPKLLLALMEWHSGALSNPNAAPEARANPFGRLPASAARDWYLQTLWVAEQLSVGYYGWRTGELTTILLEGEYTARVDMYQNAGTVGVQYLLAQMLTRDEFEHAAGPDGFAKTYAGLWGDPWAAAQEVLPGGLVQPELALPFAPRQSWSFTGGPHPAWGQRAPWAALDFAPSGVSGCNATANSALAVAPGVVARAEDSTVMLDLDGDGDERTGWVIFYFHIAAQDMVAAGAALKTGDPIGHPSCEGGTATGTHVHMARRYNGEWLLADGILPFDLGGWVAQRGAAAYQGRLTRLGAWVEASTASTAANRVYWVTP
jgi:murein DD-endopeptidase MepM/ murein hydrolase activator NlpD